MKKMLLFIILTTMIAVIYFCSLSPSNLHNQDHVASMAEPSTQQNRNILSQLPLTFVENQGQWDSKAQFMAQKEEMKALFYPENIDIILSKRNKENAKGLLLRLVFEDANKNSRIEPLAERNGTYNYFIGNDRQKWRSNVKGYQAIVYRELYEGVDIKVREEKGRLEYDLILEPGADLNQIVIHTEGAQRLEVDSEGHLIMHTALGSVKQSPPKSWYVLRSGEKQMVKSSFVILDKYRYGFQIPERKKELALVIDPGIEYSTFIGGSETEAPYGVVFDSQGRIVITGRTNSLDFPTTPGVYNPTHVFASDVFVLKIDPKQPPSQQLIFSTFIGAESSDDPEGGVVLNSLEEIIVAGETISTTFPVTPGAFQSIYAGGQRDCFVLRLSADGTTLLYSTYLGGSEDDQMEAIAIEDDFVAVGGFTTSVDFPTTDNAFDKTHSGWIPFIIPFEAFATLVSPYDSYSPEAQIPYSTFLGGKNDDATTALDLKYLGGLGPILTIAGYTQSDEFPVTPARAFDSTSNGGFDIFLTQLRIGQPPPFQLVYSTFIGGSSSDFVNDMDVSETGTVTIVGPTKSTDFPVTAGAFQTTHAIGEEDGFILQIDPQETPPSSQLIFSTFLGGNDFDLVYGIDVDISGIPTVTGYTSSSDFPTTLGSYDTVISEQDAFVARLDPMGSNLFYSSFLGGSGDDYASEIILDETNSAVVSGGTKSADFPTTPQAYDTTYNSGFRDVFLTQFDMLPIGVSKYGESTTAGTGSCPGPISIGVTKMPQSGDPTFAFTASGAPPNSSGILGIGLGQDLVGTFSSGITTYIDSTQPIPILKSVTSDENGYSEDIVSLATAASGTQVYVQYIWFNTATCGSISTLSASNALDLTVQP